MKILNWIKCNMLNIHSFVVVKPEKNISCVDLKFSKCKDCGINMLVDAVTLKPLKKRK